MADGIPEAPRDPPSTRGLPTSPAKGRTVNSLSFVGQTISVPATQPAVVAGKQPQAVCEQTSR